MAFLQPSLWGASASAASFTSLLTQVSSSFPNDSFHVDQEQASNSMVSQLSDLALSSRRPITGSKKAAVNNVRSQNQRAGNGQYPPNRNGNRHSNCGGQRHHFKPKQSSIPNANEKYSRKVFVGGLPPDIDEDEIKGHFLRYGALNVDWPHKSETKSRFPPKGYAFLIFDIEKDVQNLINDCVIDKSRYYTSISSPSIKDKPVQIRFWLLSDSDYFMENTGPVDPRRTVFVGGVPRPLRAVELATIMNNLYGGVCYAGIDSDSELKYPKGAGRVSFSCRESYIAAISARFVQLHHDDIDKRAEIKPYVLDGQVCDLCNGFNCHGKSAPYFCANITCLQYFCESCWMTSHSKVGRDFHKPLVKEGTDRPRTVPFKWC